MFFILWLRNFNSSPLLAPFGTNLKNSLKKFDRNIWVFLFFALIILWRLLLPGYVLTLDMVFGPHFQPFKPAGIDSAHLLNAVLMVLDFFLPMWLVQKIILLALFFGLGYLPYRFFPGPKQELARVWLGIFYLFNPFVYERFLAGQWMLLAAYALMPLVLFCANRLVCSPSFASAFFLSLILYLIANFSPHIFAVSVFVSFGYFLVFLFKKNRKNGEMLVFFKGFAYLLIFSFIFNFHWLSLSWADKNELLGSFDNAHFSAFAAAPDPRWGSITNIALLYGFWGENEPWINNFFLPKDNAIILYGSGIFLAVLISTGVCHVVQKEKKRAILFVSFALISLALGAGLSDSPFYFLNNWLYENLPFYSAFRDSQKWSALLAISYAFLGASGISFFLSERRRRWGTALAYAAFAIPIIYSCAMPGGFGRQLESVWYPAEWKEADRFLQDKDSSAKALFLPWHQYLSFVFNRNQVIANPAEQYFSNRIISARQAEIGSAFSRSDDLHKRLDSLIGEESSNAELVAVLRKNQIFYVILTKDLRSVDPFKYDFLNSPQFEKIWEKNDLTIYQIVLR